MSLFAAQGSKCLVPGHRALGHTAHWAGFPYQPGPQHRSKSCKRTQFLISPSPVPRTRPGAQQLHRSQMLNEIGTHSSYIHSRSRHPNVRFVKASSSVSWENSRSNSRSNSSWKQAGLEHHWDILLPRVNPATNAHFWKMPDLVLKYMLCRQNHKYGHFYDFSVSFTFVVPSPWHTLGTLWMVEKWMSDTFVPFSVLVGTK